MGTRQMPPGMPVPGVWFDFGGGQEYLIPPLALGYLEVMQDELAALPTLAALEPKAIATVIDAAHAALKRNYPALTREAVGNLLDVSNMGDVYECLMDVAGVKRRAQVDLGNAGAGTVSTGVASTPESAQTPVGPGNTSERT